MKTLKSSLDGHIDKVAMQWVEIKVSHIMNVYFRLLMFVKVVIVLFNHFYIEYRFTFKPVGMSVAIMLCIGCGT